LRTHDVSNDVFECNLCEKKFLRADKLKEHVKMHKLKVVYEDS